MSGRSGTEGDSTSVWDDDEDDDTIFGDDDGADTTTETDWSAAKEPPASKSSSRKTHYSSSVNSRTSSIPTPRSNVSTRLLQPSRVSNRAPSESSFVLSRRNSYTDPSGRETRNRSRTSRDGSAISNRNNSRWSKHSDGGYSIASRRGPSRKAWAEDEQSTPGNRKGNASRQNSEDRSKPATRSRKQSRNSSRSLASNRKSRQKSEPMPRNDSRKAGKPLSRQNSQVDEPAKRKRVPKKKERPTLKRSETQSTNFSRASTRSKAGRKQAWGVQGRGLGSRANTRPVLRRNESFESVSSVASVYSRQQKRMMENIYKMAFDAGVARGMSMSGRSGSERSRSNSRSKSRARRRSVSSNVSEDDESDFPSAPASRRSSRRNSVADSLHLSSVHNSESK